MKICSNCKYWNYSDRITEIYDEGHGYCELEHRTRFCTHKCIFCEEIEKRYRR